MEKYQQFIQIQSGVLCASCDYCNDEIVYHDHNECFINSINHYVQKHNFELISITPYTELMDDSNLWYGSLAVLGRKDILDEIKKDSNESDELFDQARELLN